MKQRQAECEKSRVRHVDFPSIPEVQNMHRLKYADRVRALDAQIQKAQDEVAQTTQSLVLAVLGSVSSQGCESRAAEPAAPGQHQETIKKQQAEIDGLKTKIRKIETDHAQERSDLQAEFAQKWTAMNQTMDEMKKDMKEAEGLKSLREEMMAEMKQQLHAMREDLKTRQQEHEDTRQTKLQSQLSRHEVNLTKVVEQRLSAQRNSPDNVSTADVSSLIQKESSALQSDISGLVSRVDDLAGQLAQHTQDTVALRDSVAACNLRLEEEARKLEEHDSKLSGLDTEALERAAESMDIHFPNLQQRVAAIQLKVDSTPEEIDSKHQALFAQVQSYVDTAGISLAELVDEIQTTVTQQGKRIGVLEESPAGNPVSAATPPSKAAGPEFDAMNQDLALIKSEFDSTKAAVDRLQNDCVALTDKVGHVDQSVSSNSEEILGQLATVRHSITVLDAQFNNLSTRALAELIIGHLEHIYPNAQQLTADVKSLKLLTDSLATRIDGLEGRVQDFKGRVDIFTRARLEAAGMNGEENGGHPGQKRRRVDQPGLNGAAAAALAAAAYPMAATTD